MINIDQNIDSILDNAQDVAVMRYVLLQMSRWFKTDHKELPFTLIDPFHDGVCNDLYGLIFEKMKEETDGK